MFLVFFNDSFVSQDSDTDPLSSDSDDGFNVSIEDLVTCAVHNGWNKTSVNEPLRVLRMHGHEDLPKDARTPMQTPCWSILTELKYAGQYMYLGIETGIIQMLQEMECVDTCLELVLNVDGLPVYWSSSIVMAYSLLLGEL